MAAPLLFRALPLLRLRLTRRSYHVSLINGATARRPLCTSAVESTGADGEKSPALAKIFQATNAKEPPHLPKWDDPDFRRWKEKESEILDDIEPIICLTKEILHSERCQLLHAFFNGSYHMPYYKGAEVLCVMTKKKLPDRHHVEGPSGQHPSFCLRRICRIDYASSFEKYMDGARLMPNDEKAVIEKLLAHHPHSEDKIGCGLDSIMVDRHPQFTHSRCLFVVRTDGGWIDFSYQKCLRAYIRYKYPSYADRFIREHFKRGSG